jgi:molybdenum cofactor cytidylyltransferase
MVCVKVPFAKTAVAVLAAGSGRRFGANKLMAGLRGIPLGLHIGRTLAPMGFGHCFLVCSKDAALMQHYNALGFTRIANNAPEKGQAHSLHLAVRAAMATKATALMITLADMPFISAQHLEQLGEKADLAASSDGAHPMPPAFFPRAYWPQLLTVSGDQGARALLQNARLVTASAASLRDIDTQADLAASI